MRNRIAFKCLQFFQLNFNKSWMILFENNNNRYEGKNILVHDHLFIHDTSVRADATAYINIAMSNRFREVG